MVKAIQKKITQRNIHIHIHKKRKRKNIWGGTKMAEQKDVLSLPLAKTPESQLAAGQSFSRKTLELSQKDIPHPKTKEKPQ